MPETFRYQLSPNDVVELSRPDSGVFGVSAPDVLEFLEGKTDSFPEFEVPRYEGEQGWVRVGENRYVNRGFHGGAADGRLFAFAYLTRPFDWMHDPRMDSPQDLVSDLDRDGDVSKLRDVSTQDLWDAMFVYVRGDRFFDGLMASYAVSLTLVANEIRRRLIASRTPQEE